MNCVLEVTIAPEHGSQDIVKLYGKSYCDIHFGGQTFKVTEVVQRFSFTLIDDGDQLVKVGLPRTRTVYHAFDARLTFLFFVYMSAPRVFFR